MRTDVRMQSVMRLEARGSEPREEDFSALLTHPVVLARVSMPTQHEKGDASPGGAESPSKRENP